MSDLVIKGLAALLAPQVNPTGAERQAMAHQGQATSYCWGTVQSISPLSVQLDGDSSVLPYPPDSLVGPVRVGDRVWCQLYGRAVVVVGRVGGPLPVWEEPIAGGVALYGTVPPIGAEKITYSGSVVVATTTGTAPNFSVVFPSPFPNGLVNVIAYAGDNASALYTVVGNAASGNYSLVGFAATAWNATAIIGSGANIRVNYIAEGW